ncbi:MAG: ankyrin repeat domain-containing protein [Acidobacteriota bacterium]
MNRQRWSRFRPVLLASLLTIIGSDVSHGADAVADAAAAAQKQDLGALRALVQRRVDVNVAQPDGTTALHWAVVWNNEDAVNLLLRAGAGAQARNRYGATPLSEAVPAGSAKMVEALLNAGADPKALTTVDGETVLMTGARTGNVDVVRMLLDRGADVNAREKYKGQTALMWAAAERHADVVKLLLDRGADWKVRSFDRETKVPRLSAASSISPIARGGFTALSFAAREGDIESARVMLDGGVDINYGDVDNTSALVVSIMNKQYSFAKFLIDRGADVNLVGGYGRTALYAIVDIRSEDYSALPARKTEDPLPTLEVIRTLLDRGAHVNAALTANLPGRSGMDAGDTTLSVGTTPLMRAARAGDTAAIRLLLDRGADPKLTTKDGNTALMFAAGVGYRDKNTRGSESDVLAAVKIFVEAGLDLTPVNARGETALHGAAERGADTIVSFLVERGAALNVTTKQGFSPLDIAMGKASLGALPIPKPTTVSLLRKLGGLEAKDVK